MDLNYKLTFGANPNVIYRPVTFILTATATGDYKEVPDETLVLKAAIESIQRRLQTISIEKEIAAGRLQF